MPSAIEVHLVQVFFSGFLKFIQNVMKILELFKFCGKIIKVYKKYQNNSWHIQIVVSVGRSQKPRKSKMSPGERKKRRRGKRYILAFPATRKAKIAWNFKGKGAQIQAHTIV